MSRVYYNKLVRDGIRNTIERKGESCEVRVITDEHEFEQELLKKVSEEASALATVRTRDDFLKEYADLMVVLDELTKLQEISEQEVKLALEENLGKKGGFNKRHYLHWSDDSSYTSNETPQGIKDESPTT